MKKSLLFLSLILCFGVVNAQNINVKQTKNASKRIGQKQIVNPNHVPTTFKAVNNIKDPIPAGYARITLTAGDIWGDGSGYQMLIDSNATAYGVEIPLNDNLTTSGDAPATLYPTFEWKIPINADGSLTTTNIVMNNSLSIDIPAGNYDYVIANPTPGDKIYIAGDDNAIGDNFNFMNGNAYEFEITGDSQVGETITITIRSPYDVQLTKPVVPAVGPLTNSETISITAKNIGMNDATNVSLVCNVNGTILNTTIPSILAGDSAIASFTADLSTMGTEYNILFANTWASDQMHSNDSIFVRTACAPIASLTYDFNDGILPADWRLHNIDGLTPATQVANLFPNNEAWTIAQLSENDYVAVATSYFDPAGQADRWLVTSRINLQGGNYLLFDYASLTSMYPESMEIKLSTGGTEPADFTILLESVSQVPANGLDFKLINLGDYTGSVRIAFRLTSNDAYLGLLDNVKILGSALSINEVENNASFGVYPNPANDFVTISDANGAEVKVIDMLGRTLISKVVKSTNETISINDLQTGMYMIQIVKDGQTSSQKLIKR